MQTLNDKLMRLECRCYMDLRTQNGEPCTIFDTFKGALKAADHDHVTCTTKEYRSVEGVNSFLNKKNKIKMRLGQSLTTEFKKELSNGDNGGYKSQIEAAIEIGQRAIKDHRYA